MQYDQYRNTKQVLAAVQNDNEHRICHELKSQGLSSHLYSFMVAKTLQNCGLRFIAICPKNIFNFIVKYINNTLVTKKTLYKCFISNTFACSFCFQSEALQHVVSSCNSYLQDEIYIWRHNSVLLYIAQTLSSVVHCSLFTDLHIFPFSSLITGDSLRPRLGA